MVYKVYSHENFPQNTLLEDKNQPRPVNHRESWISSSNNPNPSAPTTTTSNHLLLTAATLRGGRIVSRRKCYSGRSQNGCPNLGPIPPQLLRWLNEALLAASQLPGFLPIRAELSSSTCCWSCYRGRAETSMCSNFKGKQSVGVPIYHHPRKRVRKTQWLDCCYEKPWGL